jgi:hypothetical protein
MCGIFKIFSIPSKGGEGRGGREMFGLHARKYFVALVWGPTRKLSR